MTINSVQLTTLIGKHLKNWFDFPKNPVFCQVTTVQQKQPSIRTMALYDFTHKGSLIFITATNSPKWAHLVNCPKIALCMLHHEHGQIIVEGSALLHTSTTNLPMISLYWENYLDEYWRNFYRVEAPESPANEIPASLGIVQIIPSAWQILAMNKDDFLKGTRSLYTMQEEVWIREKLPLL